MKDFQNIHELLQREVSRKEFLRLVGLLLLSVIGVRAMLNNLNGAFKPLKRKTHGYGISPYGR